MFDLGENKIFLTAWGAKFYAWLARRKGYNTIINDYGCNNTELGGRYEVILSK